MGKDGWELRWRRRWGGSRSIRAIRGVPGSATTFKPNESIQVFFSWWATWGRKEWPLYPPPHPFVIAMTTAVVTSLPFRDTPIAAVKGADQRCQVCTTGMLSALLSTNADFSVDLAVPMDRAVNGKKDDRR